jgi:hypothetical protein
VDDGIDAVAGKDLVEERGVGEVPVVARCVGGEGLVPVEWSSRITVGTPASVKVWAMVAPM